MAKDKLTLCRAYVDWKAVEKMLEEKGILTNKSL
jgi:hypothetical protein